MLVKFDHKIEIAEKPIPVMKFTESRARNNRKWFVEFMTKRKYRYEDISKGPRHLEMKKSGFSLVIESGIHAYLKSEFSDRFPFYDLKYAVVPKGSEYCLGMHGDIMTNRIIIFKNKEKFESWMKKKNK